ncbi:MAG TPA: TIGR00730 family Rossman fold protein [Saprospiraceae bacterium]|nr:TIGR00730 family Rossman fold protein [Saprospiraceae bacterium]
MPVKKVINANEQFLSGPNSRGKEFLFIFKVFFQFFRGFRKLHFVGPCITVFGSARFQEDNIYYKQAYQAGKSLAELGLSVMTGGGPGIMEAANRGAFEAGGESIGCTIKLPKEQSNNPYMTKFVRFDYFFIRKVLLTKYSYGFIVMPGGFGTLDELFETLTLIQTRTLHNFPVVIMGTDYYQDVIELLPKMIQDKTISPDDLHLIKFTDDVDEAIEHIRTYIAKNYKVRYKASWILGER